MFKNASIKVGLCVQVAIMLGEAFLHVLNCKDDDRNHGERTRSRAPTKRPDPCMANAAARSSLTQQTVRGGKPQNHGLIVLRYVTYA